MWTEALSHSEMNNSQKSRDCVSNGPWLVNINEQLKKIVGSIKYWSWAESGGVGFLPVFTTSEGEAEGSWFPGQSGLQSILQSNLYSL